MNANPIVRISVVLALVAMAFSAGLAQDNVIQTIQHGSLMSKDPAEAFSFGTQSAAYVDPNAQLGVYPPTTIYPPAGNVTYQPWPGQTGVILPPAWQRSWRPYVDLEVRAGSSRDLAQGNLFVPLWQNPERLLFADLRGQWTDVQSAEGNVGLAYRQILPSQWIVGVYGFFDFRHTQFDNNFQQATFGAELLNVNWGFRANGYIPGGHVGLVPGLNGVFLEGNNIVVRRGEERAYYGVDFEVESLLWRNTPVGPACRAGPDYYPYNCGYGSRSASGTYSSPDPLSSIDAEVWVAAGLFHFDNNTPGFENMTGPRLRVELRLYDLPLLGNDSRLVAGAQYENDDVRGSVATGTLAVRIPFGPGGGRSGARLNPLGRRMVTPIVRDIDIITNVGLGLAEPAKFARSGQAISNVVIVDGTSDAEADIEGAGANSLAIAEGSQGIISLTDTIDMPVGQTIMGGGSDLAVIGCNTGARATFTAPGTRGTLSGGANTAINASNNACIHSVVIETTGDFENAIVLNNVTNVLIYGSTINTEGDVANGIFSSGSSQFTMHGSMINTKGNSADGIESSGSSQFAVHGSTINTEGPFARGISSFDSSQFAVHGGSITATDASSSGVGALSTSGTQTFLLSGVTINAGRSSVGLSATVDGTINATISGNTLTSRLSEINAAASGTGAVCLNVAGNTLDSGAGRINLNAPGTMNVTQLDPTGAADPNRLDTANGIPAANVITIGTINFNQPVCPTP